MLDVGCGSGRLAGILTNFESYSGIDASGELLSIAENTYPGHRFDKMDMRELERLPKSFDTICFVASFHHLLTRDEQVSTLAKAAGKLLPGGRIAMLNWNLRNEKNAQRYAGQWVSDHVLDIPFSGNSRQYYAFTLSEIESIVVQSGLRLTINRISRTGDNFITVAERA